jgi:hydroxyacylglutathione hydrolase
MPRPLTRCHGGRAIALLLAGCSVALLDLSGCGGAVLLKRVEFKPPQAPVEIVRIPLAITNSFLLVGPRGSVMVDAGGVDPSARDLLAALEKLSISPRSIKLLILTHHHADHTIAASAFRRATGARVVAHRLDRPGIERARKVVPIGVTFYGKIVSLGLEGFIYPFAALDPVPVDIVLDDRGMSLAPYGIPGRVVYTPGHTRGSISVLLDSGDAIVGDMAMNGVFTTRPSLAILMDNPDDLVLVQRSWCMLRAAGARTIYPGHGSPFEIGELVQTKP